MVIPLQHNRMPNDYHLVEDETFDQTVAKIKHEHLVVKTDAGNIIIDGVSRSNVARTCLHEAVNRHKQACRLEDVRDRLKAKLEKKQIKHASR